LRVKETDIDSVIGWWIESSETGVQASNGSLEDEPIAYDERLAIPYTPAGIAIFLSKGGLLMRYTARLVFVLYLLSCFWVGAQEKKEPPKKPILTDAQKLEIRNAQVDWMNAKSILEGTPQYKMFAEKQEKLNEVVARAQAGVDQSKFKLEPTLEFSEIKQPEKK
jgi:hypothetical protein